MKILGFSFFYYLNGDKNAWWTKLLETSSSQGPYSILNSESGVWIPVCLPLETKFIFLHCIGKNRYHLTEILVSFDITNFIFLARPCLANPNEIIVEKYLNSSGIMCIWMFQIRGVCLAIHILFSQCRERKMLSYNTCGVG